MVDVLSLRDLRRAHALAIEDELSELKSDFGVVDGGRYSGYGKSTQFVVSEKGRCHITHLPQLELASQQGLLLC